MLRDLFTTYTNKYNSNFITILYVIVLQFNSVLRASDYFKLLYLNFILFLIFCEVSRHKILILIFYSLVLTLINSINQNFRFHISYL